MSKRNQIPQLRCRTEFNFRNVFGPVERVAQVIEEIECPAAGIVDPGTYGHVRWEKAASEFNPMFGAEFILPPDDESKLKPVAWLLAADSKAFYRFNTQLQDKHISRDEKCHLLSQCPEGVMRFAGAALKDPDLFDYVDLNPGMGMLLPRALALAKKTKKPIVVTSDNYYPDAADIPAFNAMGGQKRLTPDCLLNTAQLRTALEPVLGKAGWRKAVAATRSVAERAAHQLAKAPIIHVEGDLRALAEAGRQDRIEKGHIHWSKVHSERLERELTLVFQKKFESYFIVVSDLVRYAKRHMLVGPGRGSSAGSLLCYVLGITEVDPLAHSLLFERFIDLNRDDLPDIDIDFNDKKRELVFDYLAEQYGDHNVARLCNVNTLQPRSALAEACKRLGVPDHDRYRLVNVLVEYSSGDARFGNQLTDTLTETDIGREFAEKYPEAAVVGRIENHAWHAGVHAAGVLVSNEAVDEYCTVVNGIAQVDKKASEHLNLLKIDALGLRTLGVIEDAGVVTADELYALPLNDRKVFEILNKGRYTGVFQFEGAAQRSIAAQVEIDSFRIIDHLTALARPGPLGGGATIKYIKRRDGREEVSTSHPALESTLKDTQGLVLYQEQVMQIVRDIGKFSWAMTSEIRKAMSGRKGEEYFNRRGEEFIEGAAEQNISRKDAEMIWKEICAFGAWGMNRSHTVAYSVISYWCAWMKAYHGLQYAAACLRSAKDDEHTIAILRELDKEGIEYTPFDFDESERDWVAKDGRVIGGFQNLHGCGPVKALKVVTARREGKLTDKMIESFAKMPIKFRHLYPIHHYYKDIYENPESVGCREGSRISTYDTLPDKGGVLFMGRVVSKQQRDENEVVRAARRGGRRVKGPTLFLDLRVSDDSGETLICRVDRHKYNQIGRKLLSELEVNKDVVLIRGDRIPKFPMIQIDKVMTVTRDETA